MLPSAAIPARLTPQSAVCTRRPLRRLARPAVGQVTLKVFDALGREVATLADRRFEAGHHTADFHAAGLIAGVYTYMLQWNGQVQGREMVVMR